MIFSLFEKQIVYVIVDNRSQQSCADQMGWAESRPATGQAVEGMLSKLEKSE